MTQVILMGIAGKVLIFLIQKFTQNLSIKSDFLNKLFACSLCLGFWCYSILSLATGIYLFDDVFPNIFLLSAIMTGSIMTFVVFLISLGWSEYFGGKVYIIDETNH